MTKRQPALVLAVLFAFAACKDTTAPGNFNPAATGQKVAQAFGAVDNNKAVQSLDVMSGALTFTGAPPAPLGSSPVQVASSGIFPCTTCLGKTFVYSTQTGKYQTSDQTGAPSSGVRFLLYSVDTAQRSVVTPLQQFGYLDLTDKSSSAANTLGIQAVVNGVIVMDYDANASINGTSNFTFGAKGDVSDGTNRLDFDLSQIVSSATGLTIDYKVTAPVQNNMGIEVVATAPSTSNANVTLAVVEGSDKLEIAVAKSDQSSSGTVKYNGNTLATVTQSGTGDPVFVGSSSRVLTADDLSGLKQLFNVVNLLFSGFDNLLVPAYFVFGLGR